MVRSITKISNNGVGSGTGLVCVAEVFSGAAHTVSTHSHRVSDVVVVEWSLRLLGRPATVATVLHLDDAPVGRLDRRWMTVHANHQMHILNDISNTPNKSFVGVSYSLQTFARIYRREASTRVQCLVQQP